MGSVITHNYLLLCDHNHQQFLELLDPPSICRKSWKLREATERERSRESVEIMITHTSHTIVLLKVSFSSLNETLWLGGSHYLDLVMMSNLGSKPVKRDIELCWLVKPQMIVLKTEWSLSFKHQKWNILGLFDRRKWNWVLGDINYNVLQLMNLGRWWVISNMRGTKRSKMSPQKFPTWRKENGKFWNMIRGHEVSFPNSE